jgi:FtsP/CotA-like multicopper oxidase with cupredoxin domain
MCTAWQKPYYVVDQQHKQCRPQDCPGLEEFNFVKGKKYLFRIVNAGSLSFLNMKWEKHTMTVVEVDGEPVKPIVVTSLDLHAGQRAGVIIEANQAPGNYWVSIMVRGRHANRFGKAIMKYAGAPVGAPLEADLTAVQALQPLWDDVDFTMEQQRGFEHPHAHLAPTSDDVHETFSLIGTQEWFDKDTYSHRPPLGSGGVNEIGTGLYRPENYCSKSGKNYLKWAVGRVTKKSPVTPILHSLYFNTPSARELTVGHGYYMVQPGKIYDVVLQNYPACNGACETHPWHLHGHHFWVVGTWPGEYTGTLPTVHGGKLYRRDTVMNIGEGKNLKPGVKAGCGFTVIRFKADNPGAWPLHCHAEWHQIMGMGAYIIYPGHTIPKPHAPEHIEICGDVSIPLAAQRLFGLISLSATRYSVNPLTWVSDNGQSVTVGFFAIISVTLVMTVVVMKLRTRPIAERSTFTPLGQGVSDDDAHGFESDGTGSGDSIGKGAQEQMSVVI